MKVFLIGESIGNVVEQRRNNTLAVQEFYIRNDIGEMVPQYAFSAGDEDMFP